MPVVQMERLPQLPQQLRGPLQKAAAAGSRSPAIRRLPNRRWPASRRLTCAAWGACSAGSGYPSWPAHAPQRWPAALQMLRHVTETLCWLP